MDEIDDDLIEFTDENYFASYEDLEVHRLMLSDQPRTHAYQSSILSNKNFFKDKIVMDVGAGTGILSFFCAEAGAKRVYAVEASGLAQLADKVVTANKCSNVIEVLHGRVEDIVLPHDDKVDVIVSEWMGFYLLHEGMLDSVLVARDKFLKPDGKMFPKHAKLLASPCSLPEIYGFWKNVYGVNMSIIGEEIRKLKDCQPEVILVNQEDLLSDPVCLLDLDLLTVTSKELDLISRKYVVAVAKDSEYQGVCMWFECFFPSEVEGQVQCLSTAPGSPATHWKQTVIVLPNSYPVTEGEPIAWEINLSRDSSDLRRYSIQFSMLDAERETHPVPCSCHMTKCIVMRTFMESAKEEAEDDIIDMTE